MIVALFSPLSYTFVGLLPTAMRMKTRTIVRSGVIAESITEYLPESVEWRLFRSSRCARLASAHTHRAMLRARLDNEVKEIRKRA